VVLMGVATNWFAAAILLASISLRACLHRLAEAPHAAEYRDRRRRRRLPPVIGWAAATVT
jgi:hypothetical protein